VGLGWIAGGGFNFGAELSVLFVFDRRGNSGMVITPASRVGVFVGGSAGALVSYIPGLPTTDALKGLAIGAAANVVPKIGLSAGVSVTTSNAEGPYCGSGPPTASIGGSLGFSGGFELGAFAT